MIKLNQNQPLISEAWEDIGMHNQLLVTVVEAIAWASYKKHNEELVIQKIDYTNWEYIDVAKTQITEELGTLISDYSVTCEAKVYDHFVRIKYENN